MVKNEISMRIEIFRSDSGKKMFVQRFQTILPTWHSSSTYSTPHSTTKWNYKTNE
jgi:hypothetical protein